MSAPIQANSCTGRFGGYLPVKEKIRLERKLERFKRFLFLCVYYGEAINLSRI